MFRYLWLIGFVLISLNVSAVQLPAQSAPVNSKSSPVQQPMTLQALEQSLNAYHWNMKSGNYRSLSPEMMLNLWDMVRDIEKSPQIKKRILIILSHHLHSVTLVEYVTQWQLERHTAVQRQLLRNVITLKAVTEAEQWLGVIEGMLTTNDEVSQRLIHEAMDPAP